MPRVPKFLTAHGIQAAGGVRRIFVNPDLQLVVLLFLSLGLGTSSAGILTENVGLFRLGGAYGCAALLDSSPELSAWRQSCAVFCNQAKRHKDATLVIGALLPQILPLE